MKKFVTRRGGPGINAGSMADIAFLLLIFFLVTTTILSDSGLLVKLPPWDPMNQPQEVKSQNILRVALNAQDRLLVQGRELPVDQLKEEVKLFILNPNQEADKAAKPTRAIVSLINDRSTSYEAYLVVYNELKAAYNEMWSERALAEYRQNYPDLNPAQQQRIRAMIPLVISEAEPVDHGGELRQL